MDREEFKNRLADGKLELKDTVELMLSSDYKDRFKAEYYQAIIRHDKLHAMIKRYEEGTLDFKPSCDIVTLQSNYFLCRII